MCGHTAGKFVTVEMTKSGQLSVASHILLPDWIDSGFKHKVIKRTIQVECNISLADVWL